MLDRAKFDAAPRLIHHRAVLERTSWSRATLRRRVASGDFPKPVRLGPNRIAWREAEVNAWMESLSTSRSGG